MPITPRCEGEKEPLSGGSRVEKDAFCEMVQDEATVLQTLMGHFSQTASLPQEPHDLLLFTAMQHFGKWCLVNKGSHENIILAQEMRQGINLEVRGAKTWFLHGQKGMPQPSVLRRVKSWLWSVH